MKGATVGSPVLSCAADVDLDYTAHSVNHVPQTIQPLSTGRLCSQELFHVEVFLLKLTDLPQKSSPPQPDLKQQGILDVKGNITVSPAQLTRGTLWERGGSNTFPQGAAGTSAPAWPLAPAAVVPHQEHFSQLHQDLALFLPHV